MKKMVAWVLLVVLALGLCGTAQADGVDRIGEIISRSASLRENHSTSAKLLVTLKTGAQFEILDAYEEWYYVNYQGTYGWVRNYYVAENPIHIMPRKGDIPARAWPSRSSKHVGTLVAGEPLTVIEETRDFWIVSFRQACCYVWKEASVWLDTEAPNAPTLGWIVLNEKQKVYTGPGTGWKALATEEAGMEFRLVGQEGNWYKIAYGDYFAYVQKSKVTLR